MKSLPAMTEAHLARGPEIGRIPAKKQNLVDKGLLAALVCCATLGQATMV